MIDTIIFDCGDVLLRGILGIGKSLAPTFRVKSSFVVNGVLGGKKKKDLFEGKITEKEFWEKTKKRHHSPIPISLFKKKIRQNFKPIPGVKKIVLELKPRYKVGLLSDNCREWVSFCEKKFGLRKLFHVASYSFQTGFRKDNVKAYKTILKKLHSKPENTLFIDDIPKNLRVARKLGIKAIEFHNAKILRKQLKKMGIKIGAR